MNDLVYVDEVDNELIQGYFNSLTNALHPYPPDKANDDLKDKVNHFIDSILKHGMYNAGEFLSFADSYICYSLKTPGIGEAIGAISLLCLIHCGVSEIYRRYNVSCRVGEYFLEHWKQYATGKNSTVSDLILFYYWDEKYRAYMEKGLSSDEMSQTIIHDDYLSSEHGVYQRKVIIIWLYENYFSTREDGVNFLEKFAEDAGIKKKLLSTRRKGS